MEGSLIFLLQHDKVMTPPPPPPPSIAKRLFHIFA